MGMSLNCPFCCGEKFTSHISLKYHILNIVDNIMCPACNYRCDNILDLTEHLGECKKSEIESLEPIAELSIKEEANFKFSHKDEDELHLELGNTKIKVENDNSKSILEQALRRTEVDADQNENEPSEENSAGKVVLMCKICNVNFTSIDEHLQKYHKREVLYESGDTAHVLGYGHNVEVPENEDDAGIEHEIYELNDKESNNVAECIEDTSSSNMVKEQLCSDKHGRIYKRKVVKIDKFWVDKKDQEEVHERITEKYISEDGKIRKITEESDAVDHKETIIQIRRAPMCVPSKQENKFKCLYCSACFLNYQLLAGHMKSHITKNKTTGNRIVTLGPYRCDVCNTMFASSRSLHLHKSMHDRIKDKVPRTPAYSIIGPKSENTEVPSHMFVCSICNQIYKKEYEAVHMNSHTGEHKFDCFKCNKKFDTRKNLEMHIKAHNNGKKVACSYCTKSFSTSNALQQHITSQCQKREKTHTAEKPHVCEICRKSFSISYYLTMHLRTHFGNRPFYCTTCGKRFKSHSGYNHHLLTHSNVRVYKCPYCQKVFKTSVQLVEHKNSHMKPFACTKCNRAFVSLNTVRAHMETHKDNVKMGCWLCGAIFSDATTLKDHMKTQHAGANMNADENTFMEFETNEYKAD